MEYHGFVAMIRSTCFAALVFVCLERISCLYCVEEKSERVYCITWKVKGEDRAYFIRFCAISIMNHAFSGIISVS